MAIQPIGVGGMAFQPSCASCMAIQPIGVGCMYGFPAKLGLAALMLRIVSSMKSRTCNFSLLASTHVVDVQHDTEIPLPDSHRKFDPKIDHRSLSNHPPPREVSGGVGVSFPPSTPKELLFSSPCGP
eukprot:6457258-Amphidinium_carterae.1